MTCHTVGCGVPLTTNDPGMFCPLCVYGIRQDALRGKPAVVVPVVAPETLT